MLLRTKSINLDTLGPELFAFDKYLLGDFSASGRCLGMYLHMSNLYPSPSFFPHQVTFHQTDPTHLFRELNHESRALLLEAD